MIRAYSVSDGILNKLDCSEDAAGLTSATWIDLLEPTSEQEEWVRRVLSLEILSRKNVRSIEASSQIYHDGDALFMNARVIEVQQRPSHKIPDSPRFVFIDA